MKDDLFNELLNSVEQAGSIHRGEMPAERVSVYKGKVLIEIREKGNVVWSLEQAAEQIRNAPAKKKRKRNPKDIREALQQTQEGFAELLGVSVRTLQNWEQGRRDPQGPAERLLNVASRHPVELLDSIQAA
jgi:putative transcriptional regulator